MSKNITFDYDSRNAPVIRHLGILDPALVLEGQLTQDILAEFTTAGLYVLSICPEMILHITWKENKHRMVIGWGTYAIYCGKHSHKANTIKALRVLVGTAALKRSNREVVS